MVKVTNFSFVVLDLSAAFYSSDYSILLQRLESVIRIKGTTLNGFESDLSDTFQE